MSVCSNDTAVEEAVVEREIAAVLLGVCYETTMGTVARNRTIDYNAAPAVVDDVSAYGIRHKTGTELTTCIYGACSMQVVDSGTIDIAERCIEFSAIITVKSQSVSIAVERTFKA